MYIINLTYFTTAVGKEKELGNDLIHMYLRSPSVPSQILLLHLRFICCDFPFSVLNCFGYDVNFL